MRTLHVVALPHTTTSKEFLPCAYTQKVLNFCAMMQQQGWNVNHYGTEGSEVCCPDFPIITPTTQRMLLGETDWRRTFFNIKWDASLPIWRYHNSRAVKVVKALSNPGDFLCLIAGTCQQPIAQALPHLVPVEWGIGYAGVFSRFRVFESYAWMHSVVSPLGGGAYQANGNFYDTVIPNSFPAEDFSAGEGKGGYALFVGRLIQRKGLHVAIEACQRAGILLKVAGQGGEMKDGELHFDNMKVKADGVEYLGTVDVNQRNALMGGAIATFVPTLYIEPFGGVAVESQLCGTPVITTDWGAFTETVEDGVTGFRCHTLGEFVWALRKAGTLDREYIRSRALRKYTLSSVAPLYDRYFQRLEDLKGAGWYTIKETSEV